MVFINFDLFCLFLVTGLFAECILSYVVAVNMTKRDSQLAELSSPRVSDGFP